MPLLGRKLTTSVHNSRQEGAMRALVIVTALGTLNFIHQIVGSAVKVLFQEELLLSDKEASYPVTALVVILNAMLNYSPNIIAELIGIGICCHPWLD